VIIRRSYIPLLVLAIAFGAIGCNPGIIETPPPQVTDASAYFWQKNATITYLDSNASGQSLITISFVSTDSANTSQIKESTGSSTLDNIFCKLGSDAITISGITAHSIIPLPNGYNIKKTSVVTADTIVAPINHIIATAGGFVAASDSGHLWYSKDGSAAALLSVNFGSKDNLVTSFAVQGSVVFAGTRRGDVYLSNDGGANWGSSPIQQFKAAISAFAVDPIGQGSRNQLYISAADTVYLTDYPGAITARPLSSGNTLRLFFTSIALAPTYGTDSTIYGGTASQGLWMKPPSGKWSQVTSGIPATASVTSLAGTTNNIFCATNSGIYTIANATQWTQLPGSTLYAMLSYDLLRSTVFGANSSGEAFIIPDSFSVREIALASLTLKPVHDISATNAYYCFAATDSGVYRLSLNSSGPWARVLSGRFPRSSTKDMPGEIVLLRARAGSTSLDSSWQADTLVSSGGLSFPITARILAHLDSLTAGGKTYSDIIAVRYAYEPSPGTYLDTTPYWVIYYAKNEGPIYVVETYGPKTLSKAIRQR